MVEPLQLDAGQGADHARHQQHDQEEQHAEQQLQMGGLDGKLCKVSSACYVKGIMRDTSSMTRKSSTHSSGCIQSRMATEQEQAVSAVHNGSGMRDTNSMSRKSRAHSSSCAHGGEMLGEGACRRR